MAGGAASDDDDEGITDINITPLVDIILVLLIVFMMTASYIVSPAIPINLPKAATGEETPQSALSIVLTREGDLYVNNKKATDEELKGMIRSEKAAGKEPEAVIGADAAMTHGRFVQIIDIVKAEGVTKLAINTQAEFSAPPPEAAVPLPGDAAPVPAPATP